jgi:flagellar basal-body rod protein FlgB
MIDALYRELTVPAKALDYHVRRHALLTTNVANAETPGFVPKDLSFSVRLAERVAALRPTEGRGGPATRGGAAAEFEFVSEEFTDPATMPGQDENSVSVEREMAKVAANSVRFQAIAEMISRRMALMKYAAADRGG